ncbi:DNA replication/checkpoint protein [Xylaria sp. CBS 124048]|nr:DNA replication/checkpoint protein [Xylaria sp. CBS 124048]
MDEDTKQRYEAKSAQLRIELKQFEADFAGRNGGKKPSRQDIKQNPSIASKYKKYNHVRDVLAGKLPATPPRPQRHAHKSEDQSFKSPPAKRLKLTETPSGPRTIDVNDATLYTPSSQIFSPAMPTSIGPTPQKNGRILGIFDLLEENIENEPPNGDRAGANSKLLVTPSKRSASEMEDSKLGRTPMSSSKRNLLNSFMTPSKRKAGNVLGATTPGSSSKFHLHTPAFLRRAPLPTVDEDGNYMSPPPLRLPPKPFGRTLSSVVAGLRKLEEEKLDDELEALHEMENEMMSSNKPKPVKPTSQAPPEEILEPDNQAHKLLGGFDDEDLYDSPTEEAKGRDGQPLRVYKKKGQKRTTRKVNMKPTITRRPDAPIGDDAKSGEPREGNEDEEVVLETQPTSHKPVEGLPDLDSDSDFNASDAEDEVEVPGKKVQKKVKAPKAAEKKTKKEGTVRKVARKVNELAHANFKRLKLKNRGTKGGPGIGSRFRRRK